MKGEEGIRNLVKEKYTEIVTQSSGATCCCGTGGGTCADFTTFSDDYSNLPGYHPDADLKLGCGIPTDVAKIRSGDVVVDLGSGAGNDVFVARTLVGEGGHVIGVDMTEAMIEKARRNAESLQVKNVEFRLGQIEELPIANDTADVVISNCVLNLVPNKRKAFSETFRILKPGGHFTISDVVLSQPLPDAARTAAELYAGCVAGALPKQEYLGIITEAGFEELSVLIEKPLHVPDELLRQYLSAKELDLIQKSGPLAVSITVWGKKPQSGSSVCSGSLD